jgi:hypothetical protein
VQYSTLLSVTCQWTECKIFWVAKKKRAPSKYVIRSAVASADVDLHISK